MNATRLIETLEFAIENDLATMVWGDTGIGKTDIIRQVGARLRRGVYVLHTNTFESVDFRGLPKDLDDRVIWIRPDFMAALDDMPEGAILFIDEANSNKSVETVLMQLVLTRQVGPHKLAKGTRIVMAGNRMGDRAAAQVMNKALGDRLFHVDYSVGNDNESLKPWLAWASANGVHPAVLAFLMLRGRDAQDRPGLFICRDPKKQDQRSRPGPRAWAEAAKAVDAPDSIRFGLIAGRVGEAAAGEFEGFLKVFRTLPPLQQIIGKPDTAMVPREPSLQYAISVALGHAANAANLDAVVRYMTRVGKEFLTVTMTDIARRTPALCETPAYIRWAAANADVAI